MQLPPSGRSRGMQLVHNDCAQAEYLAVIRLSPVVSHVVVEQRDALRGLEERGTVRAGYFKTALCERGLDIY